MNILKEKKYSLLKNILYVYKGVAQHKPYLIILLLISIISTAGNRFLWLFTGKYIIEYISNGMAAGDLVRMVVYLSGASILCALGRNAVNFGKEPAAFYVRPMFMLDRNKKLIAMPYEYLEYNEILDALQKSRKSTTQTETGIEGIIRFTLVFCSDLFTCIVAIAILCRISILMIGVVIVFGLLSYISIDRAAKREKYLTNDSVSYQERKKDYFKEVCKDFSYGKDIRLYGVGSKLMNSQRTLHEELHENVCKAKNQWMRSGIFTNSLDMLREGLMYVSLVYSIIQKNLGIGDFTMYVGCVRNFASTFYNVMDIYTKLRRCSREVNDYRSLNEFCDEQECEGKKLPVCDRYEIRFENVSFCYPGTEVYALKDINLTLSPGQKLAVVGLNGAGKTTFIKLLLKLYEPTEGHIYLNGVDIKEYDRAAYYELFAPVFQDMECYAFSLAENVSMKVEEKTDKKQVERCLRQAGLGNKLDEWPKGVDTPLLKVLHEDGVLLSGGERQKMALARALYKDAPIVILDEPTAALDAMAESRMYEEFDRMIRGKLAVYISHRLASTRFCHEIAMFEGGELIECGTHDELMHCGGKYAQMFEMQAHYYKEEQPNEAVGV
ncbi:MAG: ABC transporter ATP-binding protein [Lachnospiraceae bacterium]|nr:ABC transporter ATP-binding protein [Lachnospiraceae bacterium]